MLMLYVHARLFPAWSLTRVTLIAISTFTFHFSPQINKKQSSFYCRWLALFFKRFRR
ncbi:hypothetical protein BDV97DRAFT_354601 [Delphinella strobiligena]|nr:hypothetical protein BDV97DRAFT_354601 [Delphinella strobiligena]